VAVTSLEKVGERSNIMLSSFMSLCV